MLTNVGYVGIVVKDVAEATAFYRDTPCGRTFVIRTPQGHILRVFKPGN